MTTISLKKTIEDSSKNAAISLKKIGLSDTKANIILALDVSGSMDYMYGNKSVQDFVLRILGLAKNFNTTAELPVYVFGDTAKKIGVFDINNITETKIKEAYSVNHVGRSTNFTQLFNLITKEYDSKNKSPILKVGFFKRIYRAIFNIPSENVNLVGNNILPTYVVVMTDGEPSDSSSAIEALVRASNLPIFFQFVAISRNTIPFLEKLDTDVKGRLIDNANVFYSETPNYYSDEVLYNKLLQEFPAYLKEAKLINLI